MTSSLKRATIKILVDWKGCAHNLRPTRPRSRSWSTDPDIASAVLQRLQQVLQRVVSRRFIWSIDAFAYGGFIEKDGSDSTELQVLKEGLVRHPWTRRLSPFLTFRDFQIVYGLLPRSDSDRLPGLVRTDEPIIAASLKKDTVICSCDWRLKTSAWLSSHVGKDRICPECLSANAVLVYTRQKMVDTLIASHALLIGRESLHRTEHIEVWIASPDADFAPALAGLASWGVNTVWLQSRPNHSFNYSSMLESVGVRVLIAP